MVILNCINYFIHLCLFHCDVPHSITKYIDPIKLCVSAWISGKYSISEHKYFLLSIVSHRIVLCRSSLRLDQTRPYTLVVVADGDKSNTTNYLFFIHNMNWAYN